MVNPGAFRGAHFDFLTGEKAAYATAVKEGYAADAIAITQRWYFKRFPIDLPHTEDPSPEFLASVSDNSLDPDLPEIDDSMLTVEECLAELQRRSAQAKAIEYRKAVSYGLLSTVCHQLTIINSKSDAGWPIST